MWLKYICICVQDFQILSQMLLSDCWHKFNMSVVDGCTHTEHCYVFAMPHCTASDVSAKTSMNRFNSPGNTWSALTQTQAFLCCPLQSSRSGVTDASHSQTTSCASSHSTLAENTGLQKLFISRLLMMHDSLERVEMCGTCGKHVNVWMKYVLKNTKHTHRLSCTSTSPQSHCSPSSTYPFPHFWPP